MQNEEQLDRAKQFLPFDALKGFQEALHEQELEFEQKVELEEEQSEKINQIICSLKEKDTIEITYYEENIYKKEFITIKKLSLQQGKIILNHRIFFFKDIRDIRIVSTYHTFPYKAYLRLLLILH